MQLIKIGVSARKRSEKSLDEGGSDDAGGDGAEADGEQEQDLPFPVTVRRPSPRRTKSKQSPTGSAKEPRRKDTTMTEGRSRNNSGKRRHNIEEGQVDNEKNIKGGEDDGDVDENVIDSQNPSATAPTKIARVTSTSPGQRLKVHWARFKQRIGSGSALSESLLDGATGGTVGGESADTSISGRRRRNKGKSEGISVGLGDTDGEPDEAGEGQEDADAPVVDRVVVENELGERWSATQPSTATTSGPGSKSGRRPPTGGAKRSSQSRSRSHPSSQSKSGAAAAAEGDGNESDESHAGTGQTGQTYGIWESYMVLTFLRWRLWPALTSFFSMRFMDMSTEVQ